MGSESESWSGQTLPPVATGAGVDGWLPKSRTGWTLCDAKAVELPLPREHSATKPPPVLGFSSNYMLDPKKTGPLLGPSQHRAYSFEKKQFYAERLQRKRQKEKLHHMTHSKAA